MPTPKRSSARKLLTGKELEAARLLLKKRAENPPPPEERAYTQKELVQQLKEDIRKAVAAGHSLDTVIDNLRGVGLGLTLSSMRNYMNRDRKASVKKTASKPSGAVENAKAIAEAKKKHSQAGTRKGTFEVREDTRDI